MQCNRSISYVQKEEFYINIIVTFNDFVKDLRFSFLTSAVLQAGVMLKLRQ